MTVFGTFLAAGARKFTISTERSVDALTNTALAGWAADRGARSTPFLWGLVLATISTLTFCLAQAPGWLVLARVLQGLAASVIYTAGLALVTDAVGPDEVGAWYEQLFLSSTLPSNTKTTKRIGFVFSGMTFGLLVSPLIAGLVYDHAGYYAVFGTIFGVLGLDLLLRAFMIEKREAIKYLPEAQGSTTTPDADFQHADEAVSHTSVPSTNRTGNSHSPTGTEARGEEIQGTLPRPNEYTALLPPTSKPTSWFRRTFPKFALLGSSPRLIAAIYGCLTNMMLYACLDSIVPLFVKRVFGWTAKGAGSIFLTVTCPSLFGPFFGTLADRYGPRLVSLTGLFLMTLNMGLMGLVKENSTLDKVLLCLFLVLVGKWTSAMSSPRSRFFWGRVYSSANQYTEL